MLRFVKSITVLALVLLCAPIFAQGGKVTVKGKVVEADGTPLMAITVFDAGNLSNGTVTDENGKYEITVAKGATLVFSSLGYIDFKKTVGSSGVINVTMQEDKLALEAAEVVSVGYGTLSKRDLTGSVAKVDMETIMKSPVTSFDSAIAGRVAGVVVSSSDGEVGSAAYRRRFVRHEEVGPPRLVPLKSRRASIKRAEKCDFSARFCIFAI